MRWRKNIYLSFYLNCVKEVNYIYDKLEIHIKKITQDQMIDNIGDLISLLLIPDKDYGYQNKIVFLYLEF